MNSSPFVKKLALAVVLSAGASSAVQADEARVLEIWDCTSKNESSMDQIRQANARWVAFVNGVLPEANITSGAVTAVVGDYSRFTIVDSYPDLEAWVAIKKALETEEGEQAGSGLDSTVNCTGNTLQHYTPSK